MPHVLKVCHTDVTDLDSRILRYLAAQDWPVTSEMVSKHAKCSWNTAQVHLYRLVSLGLVKGKKVGRQNQWIVTAQGRAALSRSASGTPP